MKQIDRFLNSITMYRLVLYSLIFLAVISFIFSFGGRLSDTPFALASSLLILVPVCVVSNTIISRVLKVYPNIESSFITAFILFFIFPPATSASGIRTLILAGIIAIASKYVMAIHKKHIFNPVAFAAVSVVLLGDYGASWWIASLVLTPFTAVIGFLIIRKIRRKHLFISFFASALVSIIFMGFINNEKIPTLILESLTSWPIIFFGTVMLTEPLTTPPTHRLQIVYGALVGLLFGARFQVGPFFSTPELALIIGNIFSFIVSPKYKLTLLLKKKNLLSGNITEFIFSSITPVVFKPGQYLEWTINPARADSRGNRRFFTIASSPTEKDIRLAMKFPNSPSSFKREMARFKVGDALCASQLAGDFTLPEDKTKKLVFIAGGIGVTPFRSIAQFLIDRREMRDIIFLYAAPQPDDFVYKEVFSAAQKYGLETHFILTKKENKPKTWNGHTGYITTEFISDKVTNYFDRIYYLSGPNKMVDAYKQLLRSMKVPSSNIITDYFPGL